MGGILLMTLDAVVQFGALGVVSDSESASWLSQTASSNSALCAGERLSI